MAQTMKGTGNAPVKASSGKWWVYILQCGGNRLYTGMTNDIDKRLEEHRRGKGARFTRSFGVQKLLYREECATRSDALRREAEIKRWKKQDKLSLIRTACARLKKDHDRCIARGRSR